MNVREEKILCEKSEFLSNEKKDNVGNEEKKVLEGLIRMRMRMMIK